MDADFSSKECRDIFPVGADPGFSVIKAYDAAFNVPLVGAAFANRISYVISPDGKILYAYSGVVFADCHQAFTANFRRNPAYLATPFRGSRQNPRNHG